MVQSITFQYSSTLNWNESMEMAHKSDFKNQELSQSLKPNDSVAQLLNPVMMW